MRALGRLSHHELSQFAEIGSIATRLVMEATKTARELRVIQDRLISTSPTSTSTGIQERRLWEEQKEYRAAAEQLEGKLVRAQTILTDVRERAEGFKGIQDPPEATPLVQSLEAALAFLEEAGPLSASPSPLRPLPGA